MSNFYPLEVVGRGRETQLQVGGKLNDVIYQFKVAPFSAAAGFYLQNLISKVISRTHCIGLLPHYCGIP